MNAVARGFALAALALLPALAVADDQDPIDYRNHVMKTLGEQIAAIELIIAKKAPPDAFAVHVKTIAVAATQAKSAFEPKVAGGNSRPEVWSNWADFARRLDAMVAASNELAKAARDGNVATVGPRIKASLDCEGCHKLYMVPPKT
jgi:cytochrome c556